MIPLELLPDVAWSQYDSALLLRRNGHYRQAFNLFTVAAQKYERLARDEADTAKRLDYLEMQRECLRNTIANASFYNLQVWRRNIIEVKEEYYLRHFIHQEVALI